MTLGVGGCHSSFGVSPNFTTTHDMLKNGSHPELVSVSHWTGDPHGAHLACGVLKQVQHDIGVGGCHSSFGVSPNFTTTHDMLKNGSHPELVSGPHRTGDPHEVHLACGVLKQVQHDIEGGWLSFLLQSFAKFYPDPVTS